MTINSKAELLLSLLYSNDGSQNHAAIVGITRLEKLLFLLKHETKLLSTKKNQDFFNFVPFRMGPWSQDVYDETDFLESLGLLDKKKAGETNPEDKSHDNELFGSIVLTNYQKNDFSSSNESAEKFELTDKGRNIARKIWERLSEDEKKSIAHIKSRFNKMNLRQFLRYVYNKYPEYTTKSEIKEYLGIDDD
jgi:uncharacterized protein